MTETTKPGVVNPIAVPGNDAAITALAQKLAHLGPDLQLTKDTGFMGVLLVLHQNSTDGIVFFTTGDQARAHDADVTQWWKDNLTGNGGQVGADEVHENPVVDSNARMVWSQPAWGTGVPLPATNHAAVGH